MKQSSGERVDHGASPAGRIADLDLPVDANFISESPQVSADTLYRLNLSQMTIFNSRPGAEEQRLREKCDVPFEI